VEQLYERKEAADCLKVSLDTLGRLLSSGALRYARVTPGKRGKIVIPESALSEYLQRQMERAEEEQALAEAERKARANLKRVN